MDLDCDLGEIDGDVKVQREKHGETRICAVSPTLPHRPVDMEVAKPATPLSQVLLGEGKMVIIIDLSR